LSREMFFGTGIIQFTQVSFITEEIFYTENRGA